MSTEATGDGRPEAVDATGPVAGAELATDESGEPGESGEADQPGEASELSESSESDEAAELTAADDPGEDDELSAADDAGEDDYGEYADDGLPVSGEDDEALEYNEGYEGYESGETAEPRRARRWPRVLIAGGFVVLAAAIVGGAIGIVGSLTHGFKKPVKVTYKTSAVFSLKTGDCFDPQGAQSYSLVSCDAPHQAEVFATFAVTGTKWPGATAIQAEASGGCASRLTGYVNPQLAISLTSTYVYPDSVAWQAGTRTVICEVRAASGQLTGSVRGASAS
jgi:hypothetical protein